MCAVVVGVVRGDEMVRWKGHMCAVVVGGCVEAHPVGMYLPCMLSALTHCS